MNIRHCVKRRSAGSKGNPVIIFQLNEAEARHRLEKILVDVDVSDGITKPEADKIAWAYFLGYISGCGGPDEGTLVGGEWVIPASQGMGGRPLSTPIRINAKTGAVSHSSGPAFRSYSSFRFVMLWGRPIQRLRNYLIDHEYIQDETIQPA